MLAPLVDIHPFWVVYNSSVGVFQRDEKIKGLLQKNNPKYDILQKIDLQFQTYFNTDKKGFF